MRSIGSRAENIFLAVAARSILMVHRPDGARKRGAQRVKIRRLIAGSSAMLTGMIALALAVSPAAAEEKKGSWEFGVFAGYTFTASELELDNVGALGVRVGYNFHSAFEVEFQFMTTGDADLQDPASTLIDRPQVFFDPPPKSFSIDTYSLRFLINPGNERRRFKPYIAFGLGTQEFTSNPTLAPGDEGVTDSTVFTIGGGVRERLTPHMAFRGEFEIHYSLDESYTNPNLNVGLTWVFGGGRPDDSDGDGVLDLHDRCPDTPGGALVDKHDGCPWDIDQDGIMEGIDVCPETPRGWPVDQRGCPLDEDADGIPNGSDRCAETPTQAIIDTEGCPLDSDRDQIFDGMDRCPDTPLGAIVDALDGPAPGCPHDSDGDGVPDGIDKCVPTPPGAWVDEEGCPKDSDGDRVLDGLDQCPETPAGQKIDRDGCPRVRLDKDEPQILQNVKFYQGTELYPGVDAWIDLLVDALKYWPDVTIELGVYTDNTGPAGENRTLAKRRGEVIKERLVQHGIKSQRLKVKGYGAQNFIADNETDEGRNTNHRTEVKRLSGDLEKRAEPETPPEEETPAAASPDAGTSAEPSAEEPSPEKPVPEKPVEEEEAPSGTGETDEADGDSEELEGSSEGTEE